MKLKVFYTLFICVAFSASSHAQLGDMLKGKRQGISGKLHKKYIGKIVFAPRENDIEYPGEVESNFKDKFNFGEEIFLRAYFESTLMDVTKEFSEGQSKSDKVAGARFAASFYLDGMLAHESTFGEGSALTAEQKYKSTYRGALIIKGKYPLSDGYLFQEEYKAFTSKVAEKLTPGEHKIKIDLYPEFSLKGATKRGAIMASGEFTLVVKKSVPDDPEMCIPLSSVGVDKALEKKIYDYFLPRTKDNSQIVRLLNDKWTLTSNEYTGRPVSRRIAAVVGYKENGKCIRAYYIMTEDFDGIEYQGLTANITTRGKEDISCDCMKVKK